MQLVGFVLIFHLAIDFYISCFEKYNKLKKNICSLEIFLENVWFKTIFLELN